LDNFENATDDLQVKDSEYVKKTNLLTAKQIEKHIENSAPIFLAS
jgi:hypothetical protein